MTVCTFAAANFFTGDYARFIESSADHVINAALKKVLWRDQDYRKWRAERRSTQPGPGKGQPIEARPRV
jgi:hypothetical protein